MLGLAMQRMLMLRRRAAINLLMAPIMLLRLSALTMIRWLLLAAVRLAMMQLMPPMMLTGVMLRCVLNMLIQDVADGEAADAEYDARAV